MKNIITVLAVLFIAFGAFSITSGSLTLAYNHKVIEHNPNIGLFDLLQITPSIVENVVTFKFAKLLDGFKSLLSAPGKVDAARSFLNNYHSYKDSVSILSIVMGIMCLLSGFLFLKRTEFGSLSVQFTLLFYMAASFFLLIFLTQRFFPEVVALAHSVGEGRVFSSDFQKRLIMDSLILI